MIKIIILVLHLTVSRAFLLGLLALVGSGAVFWFCSLSPLGRESEILLQQSILGDFFWKRCLCWFGADDKNHFCNTYTTTLGGKIS